MFTMCHPQSTRCWSDGHVLCFKFFLKLEWGWRKFRNGLYNTPSCVRIDSRLLASLCVEEIGELLPTGGSLFNPNLRVRVTTWSGSSTPYDSPLVPQAGGPPT